MPDSAELPTSERAIEIITAARARGDRYACTYSDFAAREIARVVGCENGPALYKLATDALRTLDQGRSLLDLVRLQ